MQASAEATADFAALTRELPRSSPRSWRFAALAASSRAGSLLSDGLRIGQIFSKFNDPNGRTTACVGYGAISSHARDTVTSILTQGQSVYGFALTRPSEPVCH